MQLGSSWSRLIAAASVVKGPASNDCLQKVLSFGPVADDYFTVEHNNRVLALMERFRVPGLSMSIIDGSDTFHKGYGVATGIGGEEVNVTADTLFYVGSLTKAFTSASMSFLVDDETLPQVQWTTPISELIREDFVLPDDRWTPFITIEDALSHRTGIFNHDGSIGGEVNTRRDVVRNLRNLEFAYEPRTSYIYSNIMFMTVAYVIEVITGTNFSTFVKEKIWKPLGMSSTYFLLEDAQESEHTVARGYYWDADHYIPVDYMITPVMDGAGGIISNVIDFSKWTRMMMSKSGPLSKQGHEAVTRSHSIYPRIWPDDAPILNPTYGFGWGNHVYRNITIITHQGGLMGFGSMLLFSPQLQKGVVIFANTFETSNLLQQALIFEMLDDWLGIPAEERYDWEAATWKDYENMLRQLNATAVREMLFPSSNPRLPAPLPMASYAGTYFNPGYRKIHMFEQDEKTLSATWNHVFEVKLYAEHITGSQFFVSGAHEQQKDMAMFTKAEFHIDASGKASKVGIIFEQKGQKSLKVWFDRIDD